MGVSTNFFDDTPLAPGEVPPPSSEDEYGNVIPIAKSRKKREVLLGEGWKAEWQISETGSPLPNLFNAMVCMRRHSALRGLVRLDQMLQAPIIRNTPPGVPTAGLYPRPLRDDDIIAIQEEIQRQGLRRISKPTVQDAVDARATEGAFHPIREYLGGLAWDGTTRVGGWLGRYLGVEGGSYSDTIGQLFLVAMIARIFDPGCKADYMLVLEGPQGEGKSSACRILAGEWFSDSLPDINRGKDAIAHLRGKWLIEIAELSATDKATSDTIKAFVTRAVERYRPAYGRLEVIEPRQCVFIGTTNKSTYLRDETGNRRYWPVKTGDIDLDALRGDRDQILAEAVHLYRSGSPWWPTRAFEAEHIAPEQNARFEEDAWQGAIANWIRRDNIWRCTVLDVAIGALGMSVGQVGTREQRRIIACLGRLSWELRRTGAARWYHPQTESQV